MTTFDHEYSFCFTVFGSTHDDGLDVTGEQLRAALIHRLKHMDNDELLEAVGVPFDTFGENKPLTTEELMEAGWWCVDVSAECADAFKSKGLRVSNSTEWGDDDDEVWKGCSMNVSGDATRGRFDFIGKNQIHRDGNEFYWSEKYIS